MQNPIPKLEFNRLMQLVEYNLDKGELEAHLKDLTKLAAKVAGTTISLVNLIDSYTQWSVATEGLSIMQMPREDSVCQYTIMDTQPYEIKDLSNDDRFKEKFYVTDDPNLKYYWGLPLKNEAGFNLGALCVMDSETKEISHEKVELLKIIADEIINRLKTINSVAFLKSEVKRLKDKQLQVAHDIRGPIGGIIGMAQIIKEKEDVHKSDDVLEFLNIIQKSSKSLLELADEILSSPDEEKKKPALNPDNEYNLITLKQKLETLYGAQGKYKNVNLEIDINARNCEVPFPKARLLQILGNLISNAIKFTPKEGTVSVNLTLTETSPKNELLVTVKDTGSGMTDAQIEEILSGEGKTTIGTSGEKGFGFGLPLVKHLIDEMGGTLRIDSKLGEYSLFEVKLPA